MLSRRLLALTVLLSPSVFSADLPPVPAAPLAKKGALLFSDDFEGEAKKEWHKVVPTFVVDQGILKGTQTRDQNIPAADGKPEVKAHAAVHGLDLPTKNSIIELKIRLEGATLVDVEFDDRKYTGSHYGHLCRAQVRLTGVSIVDEREGSQNEEINALRKDPTKKEEVVRRMAGHNVTYPMKLEANKWYTMGVETVGDTMRVTIDGQPAAFLKSAGIGHETKSKIEFGVAGKEGWFDEVKVWNAE